jgi:membrane fusion protein, multidrug efflux system
LHPNPLQDRPGVHPDNHHDEHHVPVNAVAGTGRNIMVGLVALAVVLGVGFVLRHRHNTVTSVELANRAQEAADAPALVDVVRVGYSDRTSDLELPGEARAWNESTIYARVSGYIEKWYKDIGDKVQEGETLALIQTPELEDQLNAAVAKVAADRSQVNVAESNLNFAESSNKRWATADKGVVSEQEKEEKKSDYLSAMARLEAAKSQVKLDEAEVKRLADLKSFQKVVAPYNGVITSRRIDIGDLVSAGSTSGNTPLFDIMKSDKIRVFVDVPQAASAEIVNGMPAVAKSHMRGGREFQGTVARTSESIDESARTLKVEVDIDNPDLALKPGMYLDVSFKTSTANPPLKIPAGALTFRTGGPEAAVVDPDGVVHFKTVTISRDLGNYVELSSGVSPGEMVALNISNQVADGDKVHANLENSSGTPAPDGHSAPHVALSTQTNPQNNQ